MTNRFILTSWRLGTPEGADRGRVAHLFGSPPLSGNRTDISEYTNEQENRPIPAEFQGKPLDDPMVKTA